MDIGQLLIQRGLITAAQFTESESVDPEHPIDAAVRMGYLDEREAMRALADEVGLDYVDLRETEVD
ncbi:MAG: type II/IV secretion system protein, partial [Planctomycetota bacterium]